MADENLVENPDPDKRGSERVVAGLVRACLLSVNGEITPHNLDRDFKTMVGYHIPFQRFGFKNLDAYFEALPDINTKRAPNGGLILTAAKTETTGHIYNMIAHQRPRSARKGAKNVENFDEGNIWFNQHPASTETKEYSTTVKSPAFEANPQSDKGACAFSTSFRRPISFPPYNPPPGIGTKADHPVHPVINTNPNYKGKKFDPNYRFRLKKPNQKDQSRFGPPAHTTSISAEEEHLSDWETDDLSVPEKHVEQLEILAAGESVSALPKDSIIVRNQETLPEMLAEKVAVLAVDESVSSPPKPEEEPFGPKMILQKGIAAQAKQKFDCDCALYLDSITTEKDYAETKNFRLLQQYLDVNGFAKPTFNVERIPRKQCEIKGHIFTFAGYPKQTETLKDCFEETAANALQVFRVLDLPIEKDWLKPVNFLNRILSLVYSQPTGIWRSFMSQAYFSKFNEELPKDWAEMFLANTQDVAILRVNFDPTELINEIWKPKLVQLAEAIPVQRSRTRTFPPPRESPIESLKPASPPQLAIVEQLHLALRKTVPVHVTVVQPDGIFWARVVTSDLEAKYQTMIEDLSTFAHASYSTTNQSTEVFVPTVGTCYAAYLRSAWHRVRLTGLAGELARVVLVDTGEDEQLPFRACFQLPSRFTKLPGLAVKCALDGLWELALQLHFVGIEGRSFLAEVVGFKGDVASVYLTAGDEFCNMIMNYEATNMLTQKIPKYRNVSLGQVYEVRVTHVSQKCLVYVGMENDSGILLRVMSRQLEHKLQRHKPQPVTDLQIGGRIYFARLLDPEISIFRVVPLQEPDESGTIFVSFIDSGNKGLVKMSSLYELEGFFDQLYRLDPQAIIVEMASIPPLEMTHAMGRRLRELVPTHTPVLMKVTSLSVVPEVELFKRLMPDNILISVNNTLALDPALIGPPALTAFSDLQRASANTKHAATVAFAQDHFLPSSAYTPAAGLATIPLPKVPAVGTQFDVHVPLVSNPQHFIVQPWNTFFVLQQMMYELQEANAGSGAEDAPPAEEIAPGKAFAAMHGDGSWYRVTASSQVLNKDSVLARFADYGDMQVLQLSNMRRLAPRFCQLPCQAIRANLTGIKPLHQDWCVQDCLAFQALVNEQQFVSIVMSKPSIDDDSQDASVGLKLIDTSGPDDIHIDQLLVSEGRAEFLMNVN